MEPMPLRPLQFAIALGGVAAFSIGALIGDRANARSLAAAPQAQSTPAQAAQPSPPTADMMKRHQQMMADMKGANEKLDRLVREMNAASGEAKIAAIEQVVNELARQHKAMHDHMGMMSGHMMPMMMGGGKTMKR
ncbi:MAG: hypothetical protein ACT4N2_10435 [Hyphomicrobium sp.]